MKIRRIVVLCLAATWLVSCNLELAPQGGAPLPRVAPTAPALDLSVLNDYLAGMRVVSYDPFDSLRNWKTESQDSTLSGGVFQMSGTDFWHSHLSYKQVFSEGQGLIMNFQVQQANGESEFVFVSGEWLTDSFRQFGVYNGPKPQADLFQGRTDLGGAGLLGDLRLHPMQSYALLLVVGLQGHMEAVVWDPAADSQRAVYDLIGDKSWVGRQWTFMPKANAGETVYVDNFYKITFSGIK